MKRILLKLSGEALAGDKKTGFDEATCLDVARQVKEVVDSGVQVAVVIGGGNFWRGRTGGGMDRVRADQIGMLATVMNCIFASEMFRSVGLDTELYTPFPYGDIAEMFSKDKALAALNAGKVVFFAGGTGHPYFSTDTTTTLLAKAIDGVYDSDPAQNPNAKKYDVISIEDVIDRKLQVIDLAATILCYENHMPLLVFALQERNSIINTVCGTFNGTKITV